MARRPLEREEVSLDGGRRTTQLMRDSLGRMLDRKYFEEVLPDQIRLMEKPVRLTVHLADGAEHIVHSMLAAHDTYVILKVYTDGKPPQHTRPWQTAHPADDLEIFDQLAVPYGAIAYSHLTARSTKGDDSRRVLGFQRP